MTYVAVDAKLEPSLLVAAYRDAGYCVVPCLISQADVSEARATLARIIARTFSDDTLRRPGRVSEIYKRTVPVAAREPYVQFERSGIETVVDPVDRVRKVMNFHREPPVQRWLERDGIVTRLAARFLEHDPIPVSCGAHLKPPRIGEQKRWHQDSAYFSAVPIKSVLGIWIALDVVDEENGCLYFIPELHGGGPLRHIYDVECCISPKALDLGAAVPVPLSPGDAVVFNGLSPHASPPNRSDRRRWSMEFHFRGANTRIVSNEEFDRAFVDRNGEPAGCSAAARRASPEIGAQWAD
jgi:phytanoyl-CoA hydroxylase